MGNIIPGIVGDQTEDLVVLRVLFEGGIIIV